MRSELPHHSVFVVYYLAAAPESQVAWLRDASAVVSAFN